MKKILVIYVLFAALLGSGCTTENIKPKNKVVKGFDDPGSPNNPDIPKP